MSESIPLSHIRNTSPHFLTERRPPSPHDVDDVFNLSASHDTDNLDIRPLWKRNLHALLEQPTSSPSAFLIHILMTSLIVSSAIVTVLETVPAFHSISVRVWFGLETTLVALFTVEYIARATAWSGTGWMGLLKWIFCERSLFLFCAITRYANRSLIHKLNSFTRHSILWHCRFISHFTILHRDFIATRYSTRPSDLFSNLF
jgi:potassium voltage-gated channel Shal-related subfamily D member 2